MSEWKEYRLADFATIHNETRVPLSKMERSKRQGKYPYYGASGIIDYLDDYLFDGEYVLISEDGENLKSRQTPIAFKANGQFWVNNHAHIIKGIKDFHNDLIIYYFKNLDLNPFITGAVQPKLNKANLLSIPIFLPKNEKEQKAIAEVLSSLDDKIDLLHRQNKTLEQMAETLFRQWFVEEAKEEWEYVELKNYVDIFNGVSYKSVDLNSSNKALVTLKNFNRNGSLRLDGFKEFTGKFKEQHVVKEGDLVVAHTDITQNADIIGNPLLMINIPKYSSLIISMDMVKVVSKYNWFSNIYLYYLMKSRIFKEHCVGYSNGSTVLHLSKEAIPSFEFFLPPKEKIILFTTQIKKIIKKKNSHITQIRTLKKIRDTLLPKLIRGEVRIDFEELKGNIL